MIELISPKNGVEISVLTDVHRAFLEGERTGLNKNVEALEKVILPIWRERFLEASACLYFKWRSTEAYVPMRLELSFDEDFASLCPGNAAVICDMAYDAVDGVYTVRVDNFMMGRTYYWRVNDGSGKYEVRSFSTAYDPVRPIRMSVRNVRDIGGRLTKDGKRVKQGMIYRGYAPGPVEETDNVMDEWSKNMFRNSLGIKTDLDLRDENVGVVTHSPIGDDINYIAVPMVYYGQMYRPEGRKVLTKIFEILADESNYPIYLHCAVGTDRTGTVMFLLQSILGEKPENIMMDYGLSGLAGEIRYLLADWFEFPKVLNSDYPAEDLSAQFLRVVKESICLKDETIERIRSILLE